MKLLSVKLISLFKFLGFRKLDFEFFVAKIGRRSNVLIFEGRYFLSRSFEGATAYVIKFSLALIRNRNSMR